MNLMKLNVTESPRSKVGRGERMQPNQTYKGKFQHLGHLGCVRSSLVFWFLWFLMCILKSLLAKYYSLKSLSSNIWMLIVTIDEPCH